jgi:hypothetical protein
MLTVVVGFGGTAVVAACVRGLITRKQSYFDYLHTKQWVRHTEK